MWGHVVDCISYGFIVALPTSGIAMGYFGGKGLPFFEFGTIPGAATPNGAVAGQAFKIHKQVSFGFFQCPLTTHFNARVHAPQFCWWPRLVSPPSRLCKHGRTASMAFIICHLASLI